MSPRAGGEVAKLAGQYESVWTARMALEVIHGRAAAIAIEPDPPLGFRAEFALERDGRTEVHQVKRQHGLSNGWSVEALNRVGVLEAVLFHAEGGREYYFVSVIPCRTLDELADQARRAESVEQLRARVSQPLRDEFNKVASERIWGSEQQAFKALRALRVAWPQPEDLSSQVGILAAVTFAGAPQDVLAMTLAELLTAASGRRLDRDALVGAMLGTGLTLQGQPVATALATIEHACRAWATTARSALLQPLIERPEVPELTEKVWSGEHPLLIAVGEAGAGKTAVLAGVVERVAGEPGWKVLALRLDRAGTVGTTHELGEHLGLDGSPVAALAAASPGRPCLLVIDQLDAVSFVAGRGNGLFEVVRTLLREASAFPQMRVLLACRRFDLQNDERFRELDLAGTAPHEFAIPELGEKQVAFALNGMGLDPKAFSAEQRVLLRNPFRLLVLDQIRRARARDGLATPGEDPVGFTSPKDLLDRYWVVKRRATQRRADAPVPFDDVIFRLARHMSEKRRLVFPQSLLPDDLAGAADTLASEGVLRTTNDGKLAFFHESFFDYAFARAWIHEQQDLVVFLSGGEQELFRRAQVRQILLHLHDDDPEEFGDQLVSLLTDARIRFHLKHVAIGVVGSLAQPSRAAWEAVDRALHIADSSVSTRLRAALRTAGWFERLVDVGILTDWLTQPEMREQAISVVAAAARTTPDRVAAVLRPHLDDPEFTQWIRDAVRFADISSSRPLFDLLLESVRRGYWSGFEHSLWMYTHDLEAKPDWTVELLAAYLSDPETLTVSGGRLELFDRREHRLGSLVAAAANGAPRHFWEELSPWLMRAMAATAESCGDERPVPDRHFTYRHQVIGNDPDLDEALLAGAEAALTALASGPHALAESELLSILARLAADPHDAAQWLLYRALRAAAPVLANYAADLLAEGGPRLVCGYRGDPHWAARELLEAIAPHVSSDRYERLEAAVLGYRASWELAGERYGEHTLLDALPAGRVSEAATRRRGELERQYGTVTPPSPGFVAGFVQSPVPDAAIPHMSDDDWRRALTKYAGSKRTHNDFLVGGASQLAGQLRERTKIEPARFVRLGMGAEVASDPAYVDAILGGLRETEVAVDPDETFAFVRRVLGLPTNHDRWVGDALRPVYEAEIPDDIIELLIERAHTSEDPLPGAPPVISSSSRDDEDDDYPFTDLFTDGMNRARGSLVLALAELLLHDADGTRTAFVAPHLERFARDPSPSVRTCVARLIAASLRHAEQEAVRCFPIVAAGQDEALATRPFEQLTVYVAHRDVSMAAAVTDRMMKSSVPRVRRGGGRLAAFLGAEFDQDSIFRRSVDSSDSEIRRGAAVVCAQRPASSASARALGSFFSDPSAKVREAAAQVTAALRGERLRPHADLLHELIQSNAFEPAVPQLMITLDQAPDHVDDLILSTAARFVVTHRDDLADLRTHAAADAHGLSALVVRAYAQTTTRDARSDALDLIDELLQVGAYGVEDALREAER